MSEKYTIGIVGFGFVGKAIQHGFAQAADFRIFDVNPLECVDTLEDTVRYSDFIFVCVPTPTNFETGEQDNSIVDSVVEQCVPLISNTPKILIIKTTTVPGTTQTYIDKYPQCRIIFNPEFLTERTFRLDFINQSRVILGGKLEDTKEVEKLYRTRFPTTPVFHTSATAGELVKYVCNCFFSTKVAFFNEMYQFCEKLGVKYTDVIGMVLADGRIGNSHWQVPGHDGQFGYGGKCVVGTEIAILQSPQNKIRVMSFEELYQDPNCNLYKMLSVDLKTSKIDFKPIEGVQCRTVNKTIAIQTDKGCRLEVTPDHKMIVYDGLSKSFCKKEATELQIGDQLPVVLYNIGQNVEMESIDLLEVYDNVKMVILKEPASQEILQAAYAEGNLTYDQKRRLQKDQITNVDINFYRKYCDRLPEVVQVQLDKQGKMICDRFMTIDQRWARLVGYYLSEGSITSDRTYFSFNYQETEYIQHTQQLLTQLGFNWNVRVQKWKNKDSCTVIWVNSRLLSFLLKNIFKCGENCYTKRLPDIFQTNDLLGVACLESFIKGDGSIYGAGRKSRYITINIATSSSILLEQWGVLLRSHNIFASYTRKRNSKSDNLSYQLDISKKNDIEKLLHLITLNNSEHEFINRHLDNIKDIKAQKYTNHSQSICLVKVQSIEEHIGEIEVYSTQVVDNENFVTSGGLLISNCFPKDLNALIDLGKKLGIDPMVMEAAWKKNLEVRKDLDWYRIKGAVSERKNKE